MGNILEGIGVILFVVIFIYVFSLFIQLMSKISGRSIRQKGVSTIVARPTDFDESVAAIKQIKEDIGFQIKKLNLTTNEQIIYKFEKILKGDYSVYTRKYSNYLKLKLRTERLMDQIKVITEREKNDKINNILRFYNPDENTEILELDLFHLKRELSEYKQFFNLEDSVKIINFISPIQNDQTKIIEFLDKLGLQNFSKFCIVIDELVEMYLKNKISKEEIEKLKLVILHYKGIIDITI